jgi:hypothetical protein
MLCSECTQSVYESAETDTLIARKHVLRYLRGTVGYGLRYASGVDMRLQGYANADWAGSAVDRKSTSGCCFNLGSVMVSWCSRKQSSVALSTTEAEYIALCVAVREAVWLRKLLAALFGHEMDSTIIHCDNQSCVKLSENPVFHDKSLRHIEIWCRGKQYMCNTFLHMSRLQMSSPNRLPGQS